jgi:hypothetical protein
LTLGVIRACAHLADEKVDWFRVIVDLERQGYGATLVALSIATPKTTLLGWKQGSRPRFEEGDRLIALWCRVTGNGRETVPKVSRYSYRA